MKTNLKLILAGALLCLVSFKGYSLESNGPLQYKVEEADVISDNKDYTGDYTYTQGGQEMIMSVSEDKENLILKISTEPTVYNLTAVKDKKDQFEVNSEGKTVAGITFTRDSNGKVDAFTFAQGGSSYKWKKRNP